LIRRKFLSQNQTNPKPHHSWYPRHTNLSGVASEEEEICLLENGLEFALAPLNHQHVVTNLITDLTLGLSSKGEAALVKCAQVIKESSIALVPHPTHSAVKSLGQKIRQHSPVITKADKGISVVILGKNNYDSKVFDSFVTIMVRKYRVRP